MNIHRQGIPRGKTAPMAGQSEAKGFAKFKEWAEGHGLLGQWKIARMLKAIMALQESGDFAGALRKANALVDYSPKPQSFYLRSLVLFSMTMYAEALQDVERAVAAEPGSFEYNFYAGKLKNILDDFHGAAQSLEKAVEIDQGHGHAHFLLGTYYANFGPVKKCFAHFKKAIEINPMHDQAHYGLALGIVNLGGDYLDALKCLDNAIGINPQNPDYLFERAKTRLILGNNEGALADLEGLDRICPKYPEAAQLRAKIKVMMGFYVSREGNC